MFSNPVHPEPVEGPTFAGAYLFMAFQRRHPEEPSDATGFVDRGNRYGRNGVYGRAIEDFTKALELDPEHAEAYYDRGCSWYEVGKYDDAIADLTRAIELNPNADHYYGQRAMVYLFDDQPELSQADQDRREELRVRAQEG
ncbi:MAG: tetratricopeptide repeat protein [Chloroflexi bacterium]|nr:tetratricopeptide repeat protein [Chloroflexota bacterium]